MSGSFIRSLPSFGAFVKSIETGQDLDYTPDESQPAGSHTDSSDEPQPAGPHTQIPREASHLGVLPSSW
jgi:hypothetical protein